MRKVLRLPGPDALQCPLAGRHHRSLRRLALRLRAQVSQIHVHKSIGCGVTGLQRRQTGVRVRVGVHRVAVTVGLVAVVAVRARRSDRVGRVIVLRASQTRPPVPDQHRDSHPSGRWWRMVVVVMVMVAGQLQSLVLPLPFALVPPVLEPDLDLRGGELEGGGEVLPLRRGQVALLLEAPLQLEHLGLGEEDARFPAGPLLLGGGLLQVGILAVSAQRPAGFCVKENQSALHSSSFEAVLRSIDF